MTYRVIQWATGGVGRASIEGILSHPELELVGCWVHSAEKVGQDVGELCGMEHLGVAATDDIEALLALEADCVMYAPILAQRKEVVRMLKSGKNVVTPLGWLYPGKREVADVEARMQVRNQDPEETRDIEVAVATKSIDSPIGRIEPGLVAAQRFTWEGTVRGETVISVRTNWFMGQEGLDPAWSFGPEGERFEVEVTGDPSAKITIHGWHPESIEAGLKRTPGIVATAIHGVSAIPATCRAEPGIKSYLDLPLYTGRAAPALAKRS